jgi:hypothetical protein
MRRGALPRGGIVRACGATRRAATERSAMVV